MRIALGLAALTTAAGMVMAGAAAWERGGTTLDRTLLVVVTVLICASAHLLPALSRRKVMWLVWAGCLAVTAYSHMSFFTHASLRAGQERASASVQVVGTSHQIEAVQGALDAIAARPVTVVAAELAATSEWRLRKALLAELNEAKRAATLRDELVRLSKASTEAEVTEATDPVMARLAQVTGSNAASIGLLVSVLLALLLELTGAILWYEGLKVAVEGKAEAVAFHAIEQAVLSKEEQALADLRAAVSAGECRPTVNSIRVFLGCSQATAMQMRREVVGGAT